MLEEVDPGNIEWAIDDEWDPIDVEWDPRNEAMMRHPAGKAIKSEEEALDDI